MAWEVSALRHCKWKQVIATFEGHLLMLDGWPVIMTLLH